MLVNQHFHLLLKLATTKLETLNLEGDCIYLLSRLKNDADAYQSLQGVSRQPFMNLVAQPADLDEFSGGFSNVPGRVRSHMQVAVPGTGKTSKIFQVRWCPN